MVLLVYIVYREKIFEFDKFAAAAESGRLDGRQVSDLVGPRDRLAGLHLVRPRHDLQYHRRSTHLLVRVERRVLRHTRTPHHTAHGRVQHLGGVPGHTHKGVYAPKVSCIVVQRDRTASS